jgi:hypothetical protein
MTNAHNSALAKVFVSDLSHQVKVPEVRLIFEPYGMIKDLVITESVRPVQGLKAIVTFRTHEQAQTKLRWSVQQEN